MQMLSEHSLSLLTPGLHNPGSQVIMFFLPSYQVFSGALTEATQARQLPSALPVCI